MIRSSSTRRVTLAPRVLRVLRAGRRVHRWQEAERYFRAFRDPKQRVTLPQLKCLGQQP
jgi:hypothetical protein